MASADAYNTRMERRRWLNRVAVAVLLVALATAAVSAQRRGGRGGRGRFFEPVRAPTPESFEGSFNFCRIMFSGGNDGDGGELVGRLSARRRQPVDPPVRADEDARQPPSASGEPNHLVMRAHRSGALRVPLHHDDGGRRRLHQPGGGGEAARVPLKGGFLWADDFWGSLRLGALGAASSARCCRPASTRSSSCRTNHPLFRQQFQIAKVLADSLDQFLDGQRRQHVGARRRQRRPARDAASPTAKAA